MFVIIVNSSNVCVFYFYIFHDEPNLIEAACSIITHALFTAAKSFIVHVSGC
jgi:hypothetical protein